MIRRESDRIRDEISKATTLRDAATTRLGQAREVERAAALDGNGETVVEARRRIEAERVVIEAQARLIAERSLALTAKTRDEDHEDQDRAFERLDKREARQAETLGRDFAKACTPMIAFLEARAGDAAEVAEANKLRAARGLPPILTADERARTIPGRVESAVYKDQVVWRKHAGGPEVSVYRQGSDGELVPVDIGAVRSVERRCVQAEVHFAPQRAKPLIEAVVIPGFLPNAGGLWPGKGVR